MINIDDTAFCLVVAPIRVVIAVVRLRCHVISLFTLSLTHLSIAVLASRL